MFQVLEKGRPAQIRGSKSWGNSIYPTLEEATEYLKKYLGVHADTVFKTNFKIEIGKEYDYDGYGDTVSIVKL